MENFLGKSLGNEAAPPKISLSLSKVFARLFQKAFARKRAGVGRSPMSPPAGGETLRHFLF